MTGERDEGRYRRRHSQLMVFWTALGALAAVGSAVTALHLGLFGGHGRSSTPDAIRTPRSSAPSSPREQPPSWSPARYDCAAGYFCIYSDWNGGGTRCQWSQDSKANTADDCPFIQQWQNVRSVFNGTDHHVQYYKSTNYRPRVGSTPAGRGGNLLGAYQIRSFNPQ
jgi:hypothetical protein